MDCNLDNGLNVREVCASIRLALRHVLRRSSFCPRCVDNTPCSTPRSTGLRAIGAYASAGLARQVLGSSDDAGSGKARTEPPNQFSGEWLDMIRLPTRARESRYRSSLQILPHNPEITATTLDIPRRHFITRLCTPYQRSSIIYTTSSRHELSKKYPAPDYRNAWKA